MKKFILALAFSLAFCGLYYAILPKVKTHEFAPIPPIGVKEPTPPVTDWKKFYAAIQSGDVNAMEWTIGIENDPDKDYRDCTLFLVDGDRWYEVETIILWSCGGPHKKDEPYRMFIMPRERFAKTLKDVPSDDAKFVVVGPGRAKLIEVEIKYRNR